MKKQLLSLIGKRGEPKQALPKSLWEMIQADQSISVEQYHKTGNTIVKKSATHLENSGRKCNGKFDKAPITSFFVKDFQSDLLILSGCTAHSTNRSGKTAEANRQKLGSGICCYNACKFKSLEGKNYCATHMEYMRERTKIRSIDNEKKIASGAEPSYKKHKQIWNDKRNALNEEGYCPGARNTPCKAKCLKDIGRSFCVVCQSIEDSYNSRPEVHAAVVKAREKRVEREQNVEMLEPIAASLQNQDIRPLLPARSLTLLRDLNRVIGVDSENSKQGNTTSELHLLLN